MSKVVELLELYNPNGVFQSDLREVSSIIRGKRVTKRDVKESGDYPVISGGESPMGYYDTFNRDANTITIAQYGAAGYVDFQKNKFWANDVCYSILPFESVDNKYLYYTLKSKQNFIYSIRNTDAVPFSLPIDTLYSIKIPLPHIKVQEEIVKILDSFTNLIDALNEELSLRQKQFEYYREKLLTFDDSVKRTKLEDIGYFYGGLSGKTKNDFIEGNKKFVSYMNVFTNSTICLDINDKVKISDGETQNKIAYGDILFTGSSETPNECGMSSVVTTEIDEEIYLNSFCFGYRFYNLDGISPKFFSFLMRSTLIRNEISKTANGVTRFNVSKKLLAKVNVFIPSLKVQQSIVEKLDAFESLISSLKEEIALRQKQYEYYREKLLTFE